MSSEIQPPVWNANPFERGAAWVRADFHLHTRADKEWRTDVNAKDDRAQHEFVAEYVSKLKAADIRLGVITNHNKFDRDEFKELRKAAAKESIGLLPGVELSVKDGSGIHICLCFNESWYVNKENKNYIQDFLTSTFSGQANPEDENTSCNDDLEKVMRDLNILCKEGRQYFAIFAHVNQKSGLWYELGKGNRIPEIVTKTPDIWQHCLGFQKVCGITEGQSNGVQPDVMRQKLGEHYLAEIEGSDCKRPRDIGKGSPCYLKVSACTFDAVQTALRMHKQRVSKEPPSPQPNRIRSLSIQGGLLGQQTLNFNEDLNCLIGIRGSGKSTSLEILRYALGLPLPEAEDKGRGVRQGKSDYKQDLVINGLGSGGVAEVTWVMDDGSLAIAKTILNQVPEVRDAQGGLIPTRHFEQAIQGKVLYFGQKDLENLGRQEISKRFLDHILGNQAQSLNEETQRVEEGVRQKAEALKKFDQVKEELIARKRELEACQFRLNRAKEMGFADKLARKASFERDRINLQRVINTLTEMQASLTEWLNRYQYSLAPSNMPALTVDSQLNDQLHALLGKAQSRLPAIDAQVQQLAQDLNQAKALLVQFDALFNSEKEALAAIEREIAQQVRASHGIQKPLDFAAETREAHNLSLAVTELERKMKSKDELQKAYLQSLIDLENAWHQQFIQLKQLADKLNISNENLNIKVEYKGDKAAFLKSLEANSRSTGLSKDAKEILRDGFDDWKALFQRREEVAKQISEAQYNTFHKVMLERWHELASIRTPDSIIVEFKDGGQFRPLESYSLGQRASALLLFLIAREDVSVLMIDQPEDDLDSQTLYEKVIVSLLAAKTHTQFIFVTHNPNIPVLGDAEQILACTFTQEPGTGPKIQVEQGGIDRPEIQQRIVQIMEGGKDAFKRRKEIYKLWKHQWK